LEMVTLSWNDDRGCRCGGGAAASALLAFGVDSVIEFVAAFVVLRTFRGSRCRRRR
jgi:hypothetical protein